MVAATDMEDRVEAQIQRGMDVVKKQVQLDVHGQKTIRIPDRRGVTGSFRSVDR